MSNNRIQVYPIDGILSRAMNRLKSTSDISEHTKADIISMSQTFKPEASANTG
jgi:hypothetical protein